MAIDKKTKLLFKLMGKFLIQKEITAYDDHILKEFNCSSKTLERYLNEIEELYDHIIKIKRERKNRWKLIKVSDIFEEFISNGNDLYSLFELAKEFNPEIFKELEDSTLKKIATNKSIFLFKNYIMEEINTPKTKEIFKDLKDAVKNREYRDIYYHYDGDILYKDAKPLKLAFIDNNWYIAILTKEKEFQFLRLNFITDIKKRYSQGRFQTANIEQYIQFIASAQNAMTLFDKPKKRAKIKANKKIAKYFKPNMKKRLSSQQFVKELENGDIIFTLEYTQELEILPIIQKWLPDLIILEPKELKESYIKKLQEAIDNHK